ncbi:hypothetical protein VNO77_27357 [Canavalia gladiata]|uniref:Uncharacterized protein n=1 Tax=Canavalia gladiata TaxID=3824 RepID=A0AAN9KU00_CANGL
METIQSSKARCSKSKALSSSNVSIAYEALLWHSNVVLVFQAEQISFARSNIENRNQQAIFPHYDIGNSPLPASVTNGESPDLSSENSQEWRCKITRMSLFSLARNEGYFLRNEASEKMRDTKKTGPPLENPKPNLESMMRLCPCVYS